MSSTVERVFQPGYPLRLLCLVSTQDTEPQTKSVEKDGLTWTAIWRSHDYAANIKNINVMITCNGQQPNTFYMVECKVTTNDTFDVGLNNELNRVCLDENRRSIRVDNIYAFAQVKETEGYQCSHWMSVSIESVVEVPKFDWNDQMWPLSTSWYAHGKEGGLRLRASDLENMNRKLSKLRNDLIASVASVGERDAFYEFASVLFHRWFFGQDQFHIALRNGFKLGFTTRWDQWDRADTDLDFMTRTMLPLYQHFKVFEEPETKIVAHQRTIIRQFRLRINLDDPLARHQIQNVEDSSTVKCQMTIQFQKSCHDNWMLLAGLIFQPPAGSLFKMSAKVELLTKGVPVYSGQGYRTIHDNQRSLCLVIGTIPEESMNLLKAGDLVIVGTVSQYGTNVPNFENFERGEPEDIADLPEQSPEPVMTMPGVVDGWLLCQDGKQIGINREFLSTHSEMLKSRFYGSHFSDCGGTTASVDAPSDIVLQVLAILWHRSLALNPDTYASVLQLADGWICPIVKRYIEVAMLKSKVIPASEKYEIATFYNLDVIKYILRHPEYSTDFKITFPPGEPHLAPEPFDDEIDGGPLGRAKKSESDSEGPDGPNGSGPGGPGSSGNLSSAGSSGIFEDPGYRRESGNGSGSSSGPESPNGGQGSSHQGAQYSLAPGTKMMKMLQCRKNPERSTYKFLKDFD
ncbi:unnamed protein product [Caenorhabditis sp. 36 PRJEB53466]|nr:unnamed protein product [Caenorhabditis sp. 36 PRJEB53466]